jgi:hypothetical protein
MFFEIMTEMRRPANFARSVCFSNVLMFAVYASISALVIWQVKAGLAPDHHAAPADVAAAVPGFLPSLVTGRLGRAAITLLLTFHVSVAFLITNQASCVCVCVNHHHCLSVFPSAENTTGGRALFARVGFSFLSPPVPFPAWLALWFLWRQQQQQHSALWVRGRVIRFRIQ